MRLRSSISAKGRFEAVRPLAAIKGSMTEREYADLAKQFSALIALRNQAEYQPDLVRPQDAADAVKRGSRIVQKAKQKLPQG